MDIVFKLHKEESIKIINYKTSKLHKMMLVKTASYNMLYFVKWSKEDVKDLGLPLSYTPDNFIQTNLNFSSDPQNILHHI